MAGFTATCFGSPFDVVKTRMMRGGYSSVFDCVGRTVREEGFGGFYNGFTANFMRIGLWNICMFMTLEQIKKAWFPPNKSGSGH